MNDMFITLSGSGSDTEEEELQASQTNKTTNDVPETCYTCKKAVEKEDKAMFCGCCQFWHHISCVNMTADQYKWLKENKCGVHWYCPKCDQGMAQVYQSIAKLRTQQQATDSRVKQISDNLEDLSKNTEGIRKDMEQSNKKLQELTAKLDKVDEMSREDRAKLTETTEKVKEVQKTISSYAEAAAKPPTQRHDQQVPTTPATKAQVVKESIDEMKEREKRKLNLIIYNIKESNASEIDDRKKHDMEEAENILKVIGVEGKVSINKPVRLSRSKDPKHANKPRPLRVTVGTEEERKILLQALKNMPEGKKAKMKEVFIKKDLTPIQRQEMIEMLKKKAERNKATESAQDQASPGRTITPTPEKAQ